MTLQDWLPHERLTNVDSIMSSEDEVMVPPSSELELMSAGGEFAAEKLFMLDGWGDPYMVQPCTFEVYSGAIYVADVIVPRDVVQFKRHQKEMMDFVKDPRNADDPDLRKIGNAYTDRALGVTCLQPLHSTTI